MFPYLVKQSLLLLIVNSNQQWLSLMLSRERSFIERGIKEILESAHTGHTESSPIFRIVALQKHDSQSTKCMLEVLLSSIKFSIVWLFVHILL